MIPARWVNQLWIATNRLRHRRFARSLDTPQRCQAMILRHMVQDNAQSDWGRALGFDRIGSVAEYQRRVPLSNWSDYEEAIQRIARGESGVLTAEPVDRLIPSSGSTSACKLVPYTASLMQQFNAAIGPWVVDLFDHDRELAQGPAYWSISPAFDAPRVAATIPVGFDADSAYLGSVFGPMLASVFAVPTGVGAIRDMDMFQRITLLFLLRARSLRLISVWHPSFFSILLDRLEADWHSLLLDVERGFTLEAFHQSEMQAARATECLNPDPNLAEQLRAIGPVPEDLWPSLGCVSCWADAGATAPARELTRRLPQSSFQPKGLIATEAFVSLPFAGHHPLAVRSHFFEFLDEAGQCHLAHELAVGAEYEVIVTTSSGLYRYRLGDRVRVDRFVGQTPSLRFLGRTDGVSDWFGEKLNEVHVASAIDSVIPTKTREVRFAMLAPERCGDAVGYTLFIEVVGPVPGDLSRRLDDALRENPHYNYCLDLGQLKPLRVFRIARDAHKTYLQQLQKSGRSLGAIKSVALSRETGWSVWFEGSYVSDEAATVSR